MQRAAETRPHIQSYYSPTNIVIIKWQVKCRPCNKNYSVYSPSVVTSVSCCSHSLFASILASPHSNAIFIWVYKSEGDSTSLCISYTWWDVPLFRCQDLITFIWIAVKWMAFVCQLKKKWPPSWWHAKKWKLFICQCQAIAYEMYFS